MKAHQSHNYISFICIELSVICWHFECSMCLSALVCILPLYLLLLDHPLLIANHFLVLVFLITSCIFNLPPVSTQKYW